MSITAKDVADWALRNGFSQTSRNAFTTPFRDGYVQISFQDTLVFVDAAFDGRQGRLGSGELSGLFIGDDGVPHGIGLTSPSLLAGCRSVPEIPKWFPDHLVEGATNILTSSLRRQN